VAVQAQLELFGAPQDDLVWSGLTREDTAPVIVQPDSLTLTSVLAEAEGAVAAVNAGYFNVKTLVPPPFVRVGGRAAREPRVVRRNIGFDPHAAPLYRHHAVDAELFPSFGRGDRPA